MCQHAQELEALNTAVLIVTFQSGALAEAYVESHDFPWPVVKDETLALYHAYGMERGRWWEIWGPSSIWIYAKLLLRGRRAQSQQGDPRQLGGDVLIDPNGIVRMHYVGDGPADRPAIDSILHRVHPHRATRPPKQQAE